MRGRLRSKHVIKQTSIDFGIFLWFLRSAALHIMRWLYEGPYISEDSSNSGDRLLEKPSKFHDCSTTKEIS